MTTKPVNGLTIRKRKVMSLKTASIPNVMTSPVKRLGLGP